MSIGKGSLNLDTLKHRGIKQARLHPMYLHGNVTGIAKTAVEIGRPELTRSIVKCFKC